MTPVALTILLSLLVGVCVLKPRGAMLCVILGMLYLTQEASLNLAGFAFQPNRILSWVCFGRVVIRGEFSQIQFGRLDRAFVLLYLYITIVLLCRPEEAYALRIARFIDVVSAYFCFRSLIRTTENWRWLLGSIAIALVPFVILLATESFARRNLFSLVGASQGLWTRGDKIRCFGSFRNPSLLGSVGACFFPLYVALIPDVATRKRAVLGAGLCLLIVVFSNSGGPLSVLAVSVAGWLLWPVRLRMSMFRRGIVVMLILLAMVMKAPIWYLLARVSSVTGGTGWHRSYLLDIATQNLDQWWLIGMPIEKTAGWLPYVLPTTGGADITNQYIAFGLQGGVLAIGICVYVLYAAYSNLGKALFFSRNAAALRSEEFVLWSLGVALAAHISNWFGITYFDQFNVLWLLHLAAIGSLSEFVLRQAISRRKAISTQRRLSGGLAAQRDLA